MSVKDLRNIALAYNLNRKFTYPVCLDEELRNEIDQAANALQEARKRLADAEATLNADPKLAGRKLSDNPRGWLEKLVTGAETKLSDLENSIPDDHLLILVFARLTPDRYQELQTARIDEKGNLDLAGFYVDLACECWIHATSKTDEVVELTWDETRNSVLSPTDLSYIYVGLVGLHQQVTRIPFNQANSGAPATN